MAHALSCYGLQSMLTQPTLLWWRAIISAL